MIHSKRLDGAAVASAINNGGFQPPVHAEWGGIGQPVTVEVPDLDTADLIVHQEMDTSDGWNNQWVVSVRNAKRGEGANPSRLPDPSLPGPLVQRGAWSLQVIIRMVDEWIAAAREGRDLVAPTGSELGGAKKKRARKPADPNAAKRRKDDAYAYAMSTGKLPKAWGGMGESRGSRPVTTEQQSNTTSSKTMRIAENRLRKIILEELGTHPTLREAGEFFDWKGHYHKKKAELEDAYKMLNDTLDYERKILDAKSAEVTELDDIVFDLRSYIYKMDFQYKAAAAEKEKDAGRARRKARLSSWLSGGKEKQDNEITESRLRKIILEELGALDWKGHYRKKKAELEAAHKMLKGTLDYEREIMDGKEYDEVTELNDIVVGLRVYIHKMDFQYKKNVERDLAARHDSWLSGGKER